MLQNTKTLVNYKHYTFANPIKLLNSVKTIISLIQNNMYILSYRFKRKSHNLSKYVTYKNQ